MTREEKEIFALQAYPPDLEGNGMTWPFIDRNEPYRNKLISALESMEANGMEISICGKIRRNNTLSKKILEEGQPQGLDEAQKKDWLDKYNEDVDAVLGSSIYSEKGLDEAAENCTYCEHAYARESFKEGAEWMAGQGWHEEAVIKGSYDVVWLNYNVELPIDLAKYFKPGDKVIVQIRKK